MARKLVANLNDADISLFVYQDGLKFFVIAERSDSVNPAEVVLNQEYGSLGEAIKAITVFYVSEWESIFIRNRLSEKLEQAITAS